MQLALNACACAAFCLRLSVLMCAVVWLQVADGSYAFVLHTANPLTGQLGEVFGELVAGLGEVLVS
jgi:phosphoenolpyruvate synthase/pyruvate phosphate dikinase